MDVCEESTIEKTMSRIIDGDWIDVYLKYAENTESPTSYHVWTAISCIAGALQRKCYMTWGLETIYPNMYVILVGSAGRTRKSLAINIGQDLFRDLELPMASESITPQALLVKMKKAETNWIDNAGLTHLHSSITAFSKELVTLLGERDFKYLGFLTDWWDSHDKWINETIVRKQDAIEGMCVNILGATAPDWMSTMLPTEAIGGGFTSRCIFVVEKNKAKHVPLPVITDEQRAIKQALVHDLKLIALQQGEYKFAKSAAKEYKKWYTQQSKSMDAENYPLADPNFRAYCERRSTHLRKMCISLQASSGDSYEISIETWKRALTLLENTERNMVSVFGGLGRSDKGQLTYDFIQYMGRHKVASREKIYKHFYRDMDWDTYMKVEDGVRNMNIISIDFTTKMVTFLGTD